MADCPYAECNKQPKPSKYLKLKSSVLKSFSLATQASNKYYF